jgi:hypothetical protein
MEGMRLGLLLLTAALAISAADNTLTPEERRAGWRLLFDGKTMSNWRDVTKLNQPGDAWTIEDGTLTTRKKPRIAEDLLTEKSYGDFELLFDWKLEPGGNTGLKYRLQREVFTDRSKIQRGPGGFEGMIGREIANPQSDRAKLGPGGTGELYTVAFEFQLLDDERHPDAKKDASHRTGALYSMIPATTSAAKPAGEWNTSKLALKGDHFEHWINGTKVLEGSLRDPAVEAGAAKRWKQWAPAVYDALSNPKRQGPFALQHHGDRAWFKNIKIRELK